MDSLDLVTNPPGGFVCACGASECTAHLETKASGGEIILWFYRQEQDYTGSLFLTPDQTHALAIRLMELYTDVTSPAR
jgi:hypothetical protein